MLMAMADAVNNLLCSGRQLPGAQLRNEQLGKVSVRMLIVNRRELLVLEVVVASGSIAKRLEDARQAENPGGWLLQGESAEGDVVVDERAPHFANDSLVRGDILHALSVTLPEGVEQFG